MCWNRGWEECTYMNWEGLGRGWEEKEDVLFSSKTESWEEAASLYFTCMLSDPRALSDSWKRHILSATAPPGKCLNFFFAWLLSVMRNSLSFRAAVLLLVFSYNFYWSRVGVVLDSGVQQSDSVVYIHTSILFQILPHIGFYRMLSSLCYTVGLVSYPFSMQ